MPDKITEKDLKLLNSNLSSGDKNYFNSLEDPRLVRLIHDESFQRLVRNLRAVREAEKIQVSRQEIDSILEKALAQNGHSHIGERKKMSLKEYLAGEKKKIRDDPRTRMNEYAVLDKLEKDVRASAIETSQRAPTAELDELLESKGKKPTDQIRLVDEIAKRDAEIKKLAAIKNTSLNLIREFVGEKLASKIVDLPDSLKKVITYTKSQRQAVERVHKNYTDSAQEALFQFFASFGSIADPVEEANAFAALGEPVKKMLSGDGAEVISEKPLKIAFSNYDVLNAVLSKVVANYNILIGSICDEKTQLKSVKEALKKELQKRGVSQKEIEALIKSAELTANAKPMELRRQVDVAVKDMSMEELAVRYHEAQESLKYFEKQKESRRKEKAAVIAGLGRIDGVLERAGQLDRIIMGGTASGILESVPAILSKVEGILAEIVGEREDLVKALEDSERVLSEKDALIAKKDQELSGKKRPIFIVDQFLKHVYSRFSFVNKLYDEYAKANDFVPEALDKISIQSDDALLVVLRNYLSVLKQMRDLVESGVVAFENFALNELEDFVKKLPIDLKKTKDIMLMRKYFSDTIESEKVSAELLRSANESLVPQLSAGISLERLVERDSTPDVTDMLVYVTPLYRRVLDMDVLPEKQEKVAAKYGFGSFAEFKAAVDDLYEKMKAESVFKDAKNVAAKANKTVKTSKDAVSFVKKMKADADSVCSEKAKFEVMRTCHIPNASYEQYKAWIVDAYEKLKGFADVSDAKTHICSIAKKFDKKLKDYNSCVKFLQEQFISNDLFSGIERHLSYFKPLDKVLGSFCSGKALLALLDNEIADFSKYLNNEQERLAIAKRFAKV